MKSWRRVFRQRSLVFTSAASLLGSPRRLLAGSAKSFNAVQRALSLPVPNRPPIGGSSHGHRLGTRLGPDWDSQSGLQNPLTGVPDGGPALKDFAGPVGTPNPTLNWLLPGSGPGTASVTHTRSWRSQLGPPIRLTRASNRDPG